MHFDDIATAPVKLDHDFFHRLPKVDLHVHLDGSLRLETILDLAGKDGIDLGVSNLEGLRALIKPGLKHASLVDYLKGFDITLKVMQTDQALYRTAYELAEDAAKENIEYLEVRYSPILHTRKKLSLAPRFEEFLTLPAYEIVTTGEEPS